MGGELFSLFAKLTLDTSEFDQNTDRAKEEAGNFGESLINAGKIGVAALASIGTAVVGAATALIKGTGEVAAYGDNIDKMSQKMGMSAEAYQEWDAVMQHSGTSMETMKASMKTLANAAETGSDAFEKLGISQEELASMSQEQLFERTISALQNVEDETQRTYLAGKTLGRGATELGALLNTSAEDTQAMRDRVRELGGVMSDEAVKAAATYQDSLQDMTTAISGVKRGILAEFMPSLTTMMDGITNIFAGDSDKGINQLEDGFDQLFVTIDQSAPKAVKAIGSILTAIGSAVEKNLPTIVQKGADLVMNLASGAIEGIPKVVEGVGTVFEVIWETVTDAFPGMIEAGVSLIGQLSEGLVEGIPAFLEQVLPMIESFSETFREGAGNLVDVGIEFILNLAQGIMDSLPTLIEQVPQIIINFAGAINDNAPKLLVGGVQLIWIIIQGIISAIPTLIANIPKIFEAVLAVWTALNWVNLGKNVIEFIKNGVEQLMNNVPQALKDIGAKAIEWFKGVDWANAGTQIIDFIKTAILGVATHVPQTLLDIANSAWDWFNGVDWLSLGSNIIDGIVNGLNAGIGWLKEKARQVAEDALNAAKDFLGIKSPSKVFRDQVGKMITAGLSIGIDDGAVDAIKSAERLSKSVFKPFDDLDAPVVSVTAESGAMGAFSQDFGGVMAEYLRENNEALTEAFYTAFMMVMNEGGFTMQIDGREFGRWLRENGVAMA